MTPAAALPATARTHALDGGKFCGRVAGEEGYARGDRGERSHALSVDELQSVLPLSVRSPRPAKGWGTSLTGFLCCCRVGESLPAFGSCGLWVGNLPAPANLKPISLALYLAAHLAGSTPGRHATGEGGEESDGGESKPASHWRTSPGTSGHPGPPPMLDYSRGQRTRLSASCASTLQEEALENTRFRAVFGMSVKRM
jgi:hypothetical protein